MFAGFPAEAFAWFAELEADNSRRWFQAHRDVFERAVRGPLEAMLEELSGEVGGRVKVFRQHRDIRFSADKSPYKTRTYGVLGERPGTCAALYAEVSARGLFAGSGYHGLTGDQLARYRAAVAAEPTGVALAEVLSAARGAGVEVFGEVLKTAPRGYARDHPRVALLRHRALVAGRRFAPGAEGIDRAAALEHARTTWAACAPIAAWLDAHVDAPG